MTKHVLNLKKFTFTLLIVLSMVVPLFVPSLTVLGAGETYTITYIDKSGIKIVDGPYSVGTQIVLRAYPNGSIAWVDNGDTSVKSVNSNARGMAYINYGDKDPNTGEDNWDGMTLTMPARNVTLNSFYGDYSYNSSTGTTNEPRLIQYHLELKYYDFTNQKCIQFSPDYNSINAPAGYVINLPSKYYFDPLTALINDPNSANMNYSPSYTGSYLGPTGQKILKWVNDSSYTGEQTETPDKLFDPSSRIYVDPSNYNQIYDVMVDQNFDISGLIDNPSGNNSNGTPATPPAPTAVIDTITFMVSPTNLPTGGGFNVYEPNFSIDTFPSYATGENAYPAGKFPADISLPLTDANNSGYTGVPQPGYTMPLGYPIQRPYNVTTQLVIPNIVDGSNWNDVAYFGYDSTNYSRVPDAIDNIAGYVCKWIEIDPSNGARIDKTGDAGINFASYNGTTITGSHTYVLQYTPVDKLPTIVIAANSASYTYDGDPKSVSGYSIYAGKDPDTGEYIAGNNLTNGDVLYYTRGGNNIAYNNTITDPNILGASNTEVGCYPVNLTSADFVIKNGSNTISNKYNIIIVSGNLIIAPRPIVIGVDPIDPSTPGDQEVAIIITDPTDNNKGGLVPGQGIEFPDGTVVIQTPNGDLVTNVPNGSTTAQTPEGDIEVKDRDGNILVIIPSDSIDSGAQIPDGSIVTQKPDGGLEIQQPGGGGNISIPPIISTPKITVNVDENGNVTVPIITVNNNNNNNGNNNNGNNGTNSNNTININIVNTNNSKNVTEHYDVTDNIKNAEKSDNSNNNNNNNNNNNTDLQNNNVDAIENPSTGDINILSIAISNSISIIILAFAIIRLKRK